MIHPHRYFAGRLILALVVIALSLAPRATQAQGTPTWRSWNQPVEPFRIMGALYYVGASDIASYLITTPEGHILLEGGFVETAPLIRASVRKLGFKQSDIKIILTSHAHFDHAGGLAELKQATGARLLAAAAEVDQLAGGGRGDFQYGDQLVYPAVVVDEIVPDRGMVKLGGVTLSAHLTPGHTKGCTTWTCRLEDQGRLLDVVFAGSLTAPGYVLINNAAYPGIWTDFQSAIARLRTLHCDVFLAPHGFVFGLAEKTKLLAAHPEKNPFIDSEGYQDFINQAESALVAQLAKERASLESPAAK